MHVLPAVCQNMLDSLDVLRHDSLKQLFYLTCPVHLTCYVWVQQRQGRRCLSVVNMKKDIHPQYYEEAKVRKHWYSTRCTRSIVWSEDCLSVDKMKFRMHCAGVLQR